jgi:ribose/xylose/arabinose/galactoside ABC-type transport system permease subunit
MKPILTILKREAIIVSLILLLIISIIIEPSLFSLRHLRNVLFEAAPLVLLCSAFSLYMLCGFLDFSCTSVASFAGVLTAMLTAAPAVTNVAETGVVILIVAVILVFGAVISIINVYVVSMFRMPPALSGFVLGGLLQGLSVVILTDIEGETKVINHFAASFVTFGTGHIGLDPVYSLPIVVLITFIVLITIFSVYKKQAWRGRYGAVASAYNSLYVPGTTIPVNKMFKIMIPITAISGACYALGGMMLAAKTPRITLSGHFSVDFTSGVLVMILAGAFTGKGSIFGGKGNFLGAAGGMVLVTAVFYALDFSLVPAGVQMCLKYLIIATAVCMDIYSRFTRSPNARATESETVDVSGQNETLVLSEVEVPVTPQEEPPQTS